MSSSPLRFTSISPSPNGTAKLPGLPARTLKVGKPGWRPRSASAVGSAACAFIDWLPGILDSHAQFRGEFLGKRARRFPRPVREARPQLPRPLVQSQAHVVAALPARRGDEPNGSPRPRRTQHLLAVTDAPGAFDDQ